MFNESMLISSTQDFRRADNECIKFSEKRLTTDLHLQNLTTNSAESRFHQHRIQCLIG